MEWEWIMLSRWYCFPPQFNCNCQDRLSIFNPVNPSLDKSQPTPTLLLATVDINASKYEVTAKSFGRYNGDHHIPITDLPVNSLSWQMSEIRTHWLWYPPTALSSIPHCHQGESALGRVPGITSSDCWSVIVSVYGEASSGEFWVSN